MKLDEYGISKSWWPVTKSGQTGDESTFTNAVKYLILLENRRKHHFRIIRRALYMTYHGYHINIPCFINFKSSKIVLKCPSNYYNGIALNFSINQKNFPSYINGYKIEVEK